MLLEHFGNRDVTCWLPSCRPSRPSSGYRPSPFDCDSTSGTDAYEAPAYQPYRPALRTVSSLPTSPATAQLPSPPSAQLQLLQQGLQGSSEAAARRSVPSAEAPSLQQAGASEAQSQSAPAQQQERAGKASEWQMGSPPGSVDAIAATLGQHGKQPSGSEHTLSPLTCHKFPQKEVTANAKRGRADNLDTGVSSGGEDSVADAAATGPAAGRVQSEAARDLPGWLWRPWMWAGLKKGIKRRAAQVQS